MKLTTDPNSPYQYLTPLNTVLSNTGSQGLPDSLGMTSNAVLAGYEQKDQMIAGIKSYYSDLIPSSPETGSHVYVSRYPEGKINHLRGNSRDHVATSISVLKQEGEHEFVKNFIKHRARRPCIDHGYTIGQKIWFNAIYSKWISWVYLAWKIPGFIIRIITRPLTRTLSWTWRTYKNPEAYIKAYPDNDAFKKLNKWRKFWCGEWCILPMYAVIYSVHEANAVESMAVNKILRWIYRVFFIERHNYVGQALCGKIRPYPEDYKPSRKNRWTIRLDDSTNRDMRFYPEDTVDVNVELVMLELLRK